MKLLKTLVILPFAAVVLAQSSSKLDKLQARPDRVCRKYFEDKGKTDKNRPTNKMCRAFKACHFNEDMGRNDPIPASQFADLCEDKCTEYLSKDKVTALLFEDFEASLADMSADKRGLVSNKCKGLVFEPARNGSGTEERVCRKNNRKVNGEKPERDCVEIVN